MKKALFVATVGRFFEFERNDIRMLQSMGYEVHCAANYEQSREDNIVFPNVIKHQIDFSRSPVTRKNIKAYKQLKRIFAKYTFRIVHCHTPVGGVLGRLIAKKYRENGTKIIYTAHGFHFFNGAPIKNWFLYYPVEWICSYWTDELITINKEDYVRAEKNMHAKHVTYIPGVGIDTRRFSPKRLTNSARKEKLKELGIPNDKFLLLSVGELQDRKNHIVVINALIELKNLDIVYLITGNGKLYDKYQKVIENSGMSDNIKLLGYRTDIIELCNIAHCFVHPSIREGLGIAPLEAMACGLPLISSNINGMKDYIKDGVTGCCINPNSVQDIKEAITKMYEDSQFREKCSLNNIQIAKKFDVENTQNIMEGLYKNIERNRQ